MRRSLRAHFGERAAALSVTAGSGHGCLQSGIAIATQEAFDGTLVAGAFESCSGQPRGIADTRRPAIGEHTRNPGMKIAASAVRQPPERGAFDGSTGDVARAPASGQRRRHGPPRESRSRRAARDITTDGQGLRRGVAAVGWLFFALFVWANDCGGWFLTVTGAGRFAFGNGFSGSVHTRRNCGLGPRPDMAAQSPSVTALPGFCLCHAAVAYPQSALLSATVLCPCRECG